jgi:hypothetical protein
LLDYNHDYIDPIEKEFELEEEEVKTLVKNSSKVKNRINVSWAVRQRIVRAIVLIHHQARYFEGMAILCALAGWKPRILENEFDPPEERIRVKEQFNKWVRSFVK